MANQDAGALDKYKVKISNPYDSSDAFTESFRAVDEEDLLRQVRALWPCLNVDYFYRVQAV